MLSLWRWSLLLQSLAALAAVGFTRAARTRFSGSTGQKLDPQMLLSYGFKPDPWKPYFTTSTIPIFNIRLADVEPVALSSGSVETLTADSAQEISHEVSSRVGLSGNHGAFAAAASVSTDFISNARVKTCRLDKMITAQKYQVTQKLFNLHQYLHPNIKDFLLQKSPDRIVSRIGQFYAQRITLGGVLQTTSIVEMTEEDTTASIASTLEASYGLVSVISGSAEGSHSTKTFSSTSKMATRWKVLGGDSRVWLQLSKGDANIEAIQKTWAETVDDKNLHPIGFTLRPIWELLEELNIDKAMQLREYLEAMWKREGAGIPQRAPLKVESKSLYCQGWSNENWFTHLAKGRDVPYWAGRGRFCFKAWADGKGPAGTRTYCQGYDNDAYFTHLVEGRAVPFWAGRGRFCFHAWGEGQGPGGTSTYCQGYSSNFATHLVEGRNLPDWAHNGRFCFMAYPA